MDKSISLLERAMSGRIYADVADEIGVGISALANSKRVGHLSPLLAGQLAIFLNENVEHWMAVAAIECAKKGKARAMLERHLRAVTTVQLYHLKQLADNMASWLQPGMGRVSNRVNHSANCSHMYVVTPRQPLHAVA